MLEGYDGYGKSMIEIHSLYMHFKHRLDQNVNLNCAINKFESNNTYLSTETIFYFRLFINFLSEYLKKSGNYEIPFPLKVILYTSDEKSQAKKYIHVQKCEL